MAENIFSLTELVPDAEDKFIDTDEFCSILDSVGSMHITKNCLKYSLIDMDYVKSNFYIISQTGNTLLITK